jgi:hypothetical protein
MRKLVLLLALYTIACQNTIKQMDFSIIKQKKIEVPAVSGLEVYGDKLLMISDNTEGLSICNLSGNLIETIALKKGDEFPSQVLEKKEKSDYEACTIISKENEEYLFLIGSGSKKENRNKAKLISLTDNYKVKNFDLEKFYDLIRSEFDIDLVDFNIEALAYHDNKLYFFNRGTNEIFIVKKSAFFDYLEGEKQNFKFNRHKMNLNAIDGLFAGVSGATITSNGIVIITASAERTSDWYNDGEIVGSSVGWFHLSEMQSEFKVNTQILKENGIVLKTKIESVAVHTNDQHKAKLLLVSDNDGADSELFNMDILFN